MNKIYKLKYDRRRQQLVAVSELTAGAGKEATGQVCCLSDISSFRKLQGTLTPLAFLTGLIVSLLPGMALANPSLPAGGQIVAGQGSISTSGNQMTVNQNTHGMVANWNSFDIGKNHTVQFVQPDSSSVALNRVTGGHESQILGTLKANGQVMLINPAGVMFGKGAKVNTAGLVASTKNISNADFMAGHYTFSGGANPGAAVVNQGSLTTTKGGYIILAADRVQNSGTVRTPGGQTVLAAGEKVTLQLDNGGLTSVSVNGSVVNALVENRGLLSATDGQVWLTARGKDMLLNTVVNNSGMIEAGGLTRHGGEIMLDGGDSGVVSQSGMLLADSNTGRGGKITVEGENIHLVAGSRASATGKTGGGEVYVGGGWQGKDNRIKNAAKVVMDKTAVIDVSAGESGNGGQAVLWSDEYTNFRGTILAKGGLLSGDGGRVETSSFRNLQAFGDVKASAVAGRGGEWLLDPLDVTIVSGTGNTNIIETGVGTGGTSLDSDTDHVFSPSAAGAQVSATKIQEQLNNGTSVTVDTHGGDGISGNITFNGDAKISKTAGTDATLTLRADNNITFLKRNNWSALTDSGNAAISSTTGKLNLNLLAADHSENGIGTITVGTWVHMWLKGGDFTAGTNNAGNRVSVIFSEAGRITDAGNITLNATGGTTFNASQLEATNNLTVNGPLSIKATQNVLTQLTAGNILTVNASSGDISAVSKDTSKGKVLLSGTKGVIINALNGTLWTDAFKDANHGVDINSSAGAVALKGLVQNGTAGFALKNTSITSKGDTTLEGLSYWGEATKLDGVNINSTGNVTISGLAKNLTTHQAGGANAKGITITGSNITSQNGNVSLTGLSGANKNSGDALSVSSSNISANTTTGKILLNGTTTKNRGVNVINSNLSANALGVTGVATDEGNGFVFSNTSLNGTLSNLTNVTLSSAESAVSAVNILDTVFVNMTNETVRDTLLVKGIENMTLLNATGVTFGGSGNDWVKDYRNGKSGGWIFNNATVNKTGNISLKGAGFTDSSLTAGKNLTIDNGTQLLTLNGTNVSAGGNITLTAAGGISYVGGDKENKLNMTAGQNISVNASAGSVEIKNANLNATAGDIQVTSVSALGKVASIRFIDSVLTAANTITAATTSDDSGYWYTSYDPSKAALLLTGTNNFSAKKINLSAHVKKGTNSDSSGAFMFDSGSHTTFNGTTTINGTVDNKSYGVGILSRNNGADIYASNGGLSLTAAGAQAISGLAAGGVWTDFGMRFHLTDSDLNITATGQKGGIFFEPDYAARAGLTFNGTGNVSVTSTTTGGDGINLSILDSGNLKGKVAVSGTSVTGNGIDINANAVVKLSDATIEGTSKSGVGISVNATGSTRPGNNISISNSKISGSSDTGSAGVAFRAGPNITLASGSVKGVVKAGTGSGVSLQGSKPITVSGTQINGTAAEGTGVVVTGRLNTSENTALTGSATGSGSGVDIQGTLNGTGTNAVVYGTSEGGSGVKITGVASGVNITGIAVSGTGTELTDKAVVHNGTMNGSSASGTGVKIAGIASGLDITGIANSGTATELADKANVRKTMVTGISDSGAGVAVTGNVTLDETSASSLAGSATDGDGLALKDTAVVNVVKQGSSEPVTTAVQLNGTSENGSGVSTSGDVTLNRVILNGSSTGSGTGVTLGGNLTLGDTVSGVNAAAANGTAINLNNVTFNATNHGTDPLRLNPAVTGDNGTAIKVSGDTELINVALDGNAANGRGVVIDGNLTTNRSVSGTTENGTALTISGRLVNGAGLPVEGTATGGGTGVSITGNTGDNRVSGTSSSGTGVSLGDGAVTGTGSTVTGTSETGSGAVINGSVNNQGTVSGTSQKGNGADLLAAGILRGAGSVSGSSTAGTGVS
ncbi:filamentous hemagglutinin N-terminal domain-containing protein, partial [Salmonella enterica]|nr:filamentous hemagglutinin N-terminal domain-containing protein [Salmonella enterica]